MGKAIGIDLGTTNCCIAVKEGGNPRVIATREGSRTTPSIVAFTPRGERLVGQIAKRQSLTNPQSTIYAVKRLVGRKFDSAEVAKAMQLVPYEIVASQNRDAWIRVRGKDYSPAEISAYESLGLCPKGDGGKLIDEGATRLGGRLPVNTSGGLLRKGHPVGATGIAQIVELTEQLQGRSGPRQVEGAKLALAHNGGGNIGIDAAAMCVTILSI